MDPSQRPDPYQEPQPYQNPDPYQQPGYYQPPSPYQQPVNPYGYPRKPGKVQAIAIMSLVDGIWNILWGVGLIATICAAPLGIYAIVVAILGIMYASKLLSEYPQGVKPNRTLAILQIANLITLNLVSVVIGIICLIFYDDLEVRQYYEAIARQSPQDM